MRVSLLCLLCLVVLVYCLVLCLSTSAKRLAGKTTLVICFVSKCFPYKDWIEELFFIMLYCMYSQHATVLTFH